MIKFRPTTWPPREEIERRLERVQQMAGLALTRSLRLEAGTALVVVGVVESVVHAARTVLPRGVHLAHVLGIARGAAATLLLLVGALQVAACAALLLPAVYRELGAMAPAVALAVSLWLERALMGADGDGAVTVALVLQTAALALLALFRVDRQARNGALGVPTDSRVLQVEGWVRAAAGRARARWAAPTLGVLLLGWAWAHDAFWRASRHDYERARATFHAKLAGAACSLLVAAQDTRPRPYAFEGGGWWPWWPWSSWSSWRRKAKTI